MGFDPSGKRLLRVGGFATGGRDRIASKIAGSGGDICPVHIPDSRKWLLPQGLDFRFHGPS